MKRGAGSGERGVGNEKGGGGGGKNALPNLNPSSIINFTVMYFHFSAFFFIFHFPVPLFRNIKTQCLV